MEIVRVDQGVEPVSKVTDSTHTCTLYTFKCTCASLQLFFE